MEFKEKLAIGPSNVVDTAGAAVKVANKYSYMANAKTETVGAADGEQPCGRDADILSVSSAMLGLMCCGCRHLQMHGTTDERDRL